MSSAASVTMKEFEVPVPWGKMTGLEWGDETGHPWIVLHGWLDNCGSFNGLAPLLAAKGHRLICVDLPGHGFSSHYPEGFTYHFMDGVQNVRRIAEHFKLSKFSLLGHSMGGGIACSYAATHPEQSVQRTRAGINSIFDVEKKLRDGQEPVHSFEEAKVKLIGNYMKLHGTKDATTVITPESADALLKRGLKPSKCGSGFVYSRDLKLMARGVYGYPFDVWSEFAKAIVCPHLIVTAKSKPGYFAEAAGALDKVTAVYQSSNPSFYLRPTEGNHFLHLNNPDKVLVHVEEMLEKHPVKLV